MKTIVFAGPSMSEEASTLATSKGMQIKPMAKRGDIAEAVDDGADCIILIDGEMISNYAPSVAEVRDAAAARFVIGSSSLGALRAAELVGSGIFGTGWVFKQFVSGDLHRDQDLLSLILDLDGGIQLTIPQINIRFGIRQLLRAGKINLKQGSKLEYLLSQVHFEERSPEVVKNIIADLCFSNEVGDFLCSADSDIKKMDTFRCIRTISKLSA